MKFHVKITETVALLIAVCFYEYKKQFDDVDSFGCGNVTLSEISTERFFKAEMYSV